MDKFNIIVKIPKHRAGVYVIYNPVTKRAYVGESINICRRLSEHLDGICRNNTQNSNNNLCDEKEKSFVVISIIMSDYKKNESIPSWTIHETCVMYVLRKMGISLYNGNDDKDNIGKKRSFLYNNNLPDEMIRKKVLNFLIDLSHGNPEYYENLFIRIENELNNTLFNTLLPMNSETGCITKYTHTQWTKREREIVKNDTDWIQIKTQSDYNKIRKILKQRRLSKSDFAEIKIESISSCEIQEYIDTGKLDRVVFHKFGNYAGQDIFDILATKATDLRKVKYSELEGVYNKNMKNVNICLWTLKRLPIDLARPFLSNINTDRNPKYLLMVYTPSKGNSSKIDKSDDDAPNPKGYLSVDGLKTIKSMYSFPENMESLVVTKHGPSGNQSGNKALIISDIRFFNGTVDMNKLYSNYNSIVEGSKNELTTTFIRNSSVCALLKEDKKNEIKELFENAEENSENEFTSFLLARLEYPYIIELVN